MHKALHLTDKLYVSKKVGGRGLASFQDSVGDRYHDDDYIHKRREKQITAIKNNTDNTIISKTEMNRKEKWKAKQLYGRFKRQTNEISRKKTRT